MSNPIAVVYIGNTQTTNHVPAMLGKSATHAIVARLLLDSHSPLCHWMLVAFAPIILQEADSKGREEWMLVPPKSLGVLGAIKTLNPTNRKFQT